MQVSECTSAHEGDNEGLQSRLMFAYANFRVQNYYFSYNPTITFIWYFSQPSVISVVHKYLKVVNTCDNFLRRP